MDPLVTPVVIGGLGAVIWWAATRPKPFNKLMRTLDLKNKEGKYPYQLDHDVGPRTETYVIEVPDGIPYEVFSDPKSKIFQTVRQSIGNMHRLEVVPIDGHKLAIRVILEELRDNYAYDPAPADKGNPLVFRIGESLAGPVTFTIGNDAPHLCVAGTTGSGKSVCLRSMITSMVLHPRRVDLFLVDLKGGVEFQPFQACERVAGYARSVPEGVGLLRKLQDEMIRRNDAFYRAGVNSIDAYNKLGRDRLRRQVLVVDEFAEFTASKDRDAQAILKDLLRRARSCGIHVLIATQRPDADVIDGQIRANMPAYICHMVSSSSNSIVVLGHGGAESLPGHGRAILRAPGRKEVEIQGYYLGEDECREMVRHTYVKKAEQPENTNGVGSQWQSSSRETKRP